MQQTLGRERAGALVEEIAGAIARGLVARGVRRLVVAGGETSGAVVQALGVTGLRIGRQIDPGVPWTVSLGRARPLALALKSGNFGAPDFFLRAFERARMEQRHERNPGPRGDLRDRRVDLRPRPDRRLVRQYQRAGRRMAG